MTNIEVILKELERLFPNPVIELNYTKDYELLIAVMLSSQTTDKRVNLVTNKLFSKYLDLNSLKDADVNDLMDIIKPIGTYRKKSLFIKSIANELYYKYNSLVPNNRIQLESLDGVGRKTANVVLSVLYNEPCIAVDTHVKRVSKRLGLALKDDNVKVIEQKLEKLIAKDKRSKAHHQLVLFGRYYCKALKPKCKNCELINICKEKVMD
ncbi:MAG: endonuclease III [Bacilli bacterium]|nr:endonuclease III [Bacilli bacterium]